jgi:hypothetical protein
MTSTDIFLAKLRRAGVVLRASGDRLVVEAPVGLVTPQLRGELARRKEELVFALQDSIDVRIVPSDRELIHDVARLLATGYRRYLNRQTASVGGLESANGVAFSGAGSVHEGGLQDAD